MGEYADDYFRREVKSRFGFDPGESVASITSKVRCPKCQRRVKAAGLADHMRDAHGIAKEATAKPRPRAQQQPAGTFRHFATPEAESEHLAQVKAAQDNKEVPF